MQAVEPILPFTEIAAALDEMGRTICAMPKRSHERIIAEERIKRMRTAAIRSELAALSKSTKIVEVSDER